MPKILFIQPSQYRNRSGSLVKQDRLYLPGLVFPLLAAMTPKHWEIDTCMEVIEEVNFDSDADLVAIGAMGQSLFRGLDIAREFKVRGKTVIFGGYMASMIPETALDQADSVIIGDAEDAYLELLHDFEHLGKLKRRYEKPVNDLKGLPLPRYELLTQKKIGFMLPVQAGRGCPHQCSFCSIACLYRGVHLTRPIPEVIRDIKEVKRLGFKYFYLIDDNLSANPDYLSQLCDEIIPLNMQWATQCTLNLARHPELLKKVAQSGCRILSIGIESITQGGMDKTNKKWLRVDDHAELIRRIHDAGIMISAEMVIGTDSDTVQSIRDTFDFIMKNKIALVRYYVLTPVPGTDLYKELHEGGRLLHERWAEYNCVGCVHVPEMISPEEVNKMYWWIFRRTLSFGSILRRTILHRRVLKNPLLHTYALVVNFHYLNTLRKGDAPIIV